MKMIYLFSYRLMRAGGTENLVLKLAACLRQQNVEVRCVCEFCSAEMKNQLLQNGTVIDEIMWPELDRYLAGFDKKVKLQIVTFEWNTFLSFFYCKRENKKTLLYVVHPECIRGQWENGSAQYYHKDLRVYDKREVLMFLQKMVETKHIVVMDEVVKEETERFFAKKIDFNYLRISVDIVDDWSHIESANKKRFYDRKISTAARADFPFKGYLLGLIEWFADNHTLFGGLEIVSYGANFALLEEKIEKLPAEVRDKIHLHGKLPYDELRKVISSSFLFVGMGTSVIDAAEMGVITIPIKPFEYELMVNARFDENPYAVCAADIYPYQDFTVMIRDVVNFSLDDYSEASRKSYTSVCKIYGTDNIVKELQRILDSCTEDIKTMEGGFYSVDNKAYDCLYKSFEDVNQAKGERKLAVYGAGIGGRDYVLKYMDYGGRVDCFIDKQPECYGSIYGIPVYKPDWINCEDYYVVISLKTYVDEIVSYLKKQGFKVKEDFCYPYCELEKGVV